MTYEEFCKTHYSKSVQQYEMYQLTLLPEQLIGKVLVAVTSGYSCGSEGGTRVRVKDITKSVWVNLEDYNEGECIKRTNCFGYQVNINDLWKDFRLATPEEIEQFDKEEEERLYQVTYKKEIEEKKERELYEKLKKKFEN
jgi:hypothetical protein